MKKHLDVDLRVILRDAVKDDYLLPLKRVRESLDEKLFHRRPVPHPGHHLPSGTLFSLTDVRVSGDDETVSGYPTAAHGPYTNPEDPCHQGKDGSNLDPFAGLSTSWATTT